MADEQISLSSLLFIVVVSGLAIRYFFFSGSSSQPAPRPSARDAAGAARAREQAVERIQQMFPQVDRRTILWDLQRTGGSVQATTERILSGRVETPPVTFQPPPPPSSPMPPAQTPAAKPSTRSAEPDLITRYNLHSKVSQAGEDAANGKKGWSSNREERQSALQRRRDEMILAARKKMEEKIRAEKETGKST